MSLFQTILPEDILYQVKISCQIHNYVEAIAIRKIIRYTAEKEGVIVEKEELQKVADNIRLSHNLLKSEDTWAWLDKHCLSVEDLEEIAKNNLLSSKLAIHLFAGQVESFFIENRQMYTGAVTYEVILDDEDIALQLFTNLQTGEVTFPEIARQYIQDPDIRRLGGYKGICYYHNLKPEIADAIFTTQPPQIIQPLITSEGVHLIWVEEIIQPILDEQLKTKILGDLFSQWLKQQVAEFDYRVSGVKEIRPVNSTLY